MRNKGRGGIKKIRTRIGKLWSKSSHLGPFPPLVSFSSHDASLAWFSHLARFQTTLFTVRNIQLSNGERFKSLSKTISQSSENNDEGKRSVDWNKYSPFLSKSKWTLLNQPTFLAGSPIFFLWKTLLALQHSFISVVNFWISFVTRLVTHSGELSASEIFFFFPRHFVRVLFRNRTIWFLCVFV